MVVICKCGQKNRVKSAFVSGQSTAKAINCGHCKTPLADIMAIQVDRNADIVLDIAELFIKKKGGGEFDTHGEIRAIFRKHGMELGPHDLEDDLDEDEEEDEDLEDELDEADEDEDEEPTPKKKKVVKKKSSKKRSH